MTFDEFTLGLSKGLYEIELNDKKCFIPSKESFNDAVGGFKEEYDKDELIKYYVANNMINELDQYLLVSCLKYDDLSWIYNDFKKSQISDIIYWFKQKKEYFEEVSLKEYLDARYSPNISSKDRLEELTKSYCQSRNLVNDFYDKVMEFDLKELYQLSKSIYNRHYMHLMINSYQLAQEARIDKQDESNNQK